MATLSLGFSPCPNDTFIFDALVNGKIDTKGVDFEVFMADVAELNQRAFEGDLHITKLSYHALAYLLPNYELLRVGSALGNNCGPLLIAKQAFGFEEVKDLKIAIPGKYTTANFLLELAFPQAKNKIELLFSEIEGAVLNGTVDAGLIIHENRFTYEQKGLVKIIDLGEYWESTTQLPIPLGGIAIKRDLPTETKQLVQQLLGESVAHAFDNRMGALPYIRQYAQEMDEKVMFQHINLYVNDYTLNLGEIGTQAIEKLFAMAWEKQLIPPFEGNVLL